MHRWRWPMRWEITRYHFKTCVYVCICTQPHSEYVYICSKHIGTFTQLKPFQYVHDIFLPLTRTIHFVALTESIAQIPFKLQFLSTMQDCSVESPSLTSTNLQQPTSSSSDPSIFEGIPPVSFKYPLCFHRNKLFLIICYNPVKPSRIFPPVHTNNSHPLYTMHCKK